MSSQEGVNVKTEDITTERDIFWATVKIEEDVNPPGPPAFTYVNVKQEPCDPDEMSSLVDALSVELDSFLPPVEKITVNLLAFKPEHDEDTTGLKLRQPETDPLLLPYVKQEETGGEHACRHPEKMKAVTSTEYLTSYCGDYDNSFKSEPKEYADSESLAFSQVVDRCDARASRSKTSDSVETPTTVQVGGVPLPFECNVCGKRFKRRWSLNRHIFTHDEDGKRNFMCNFLKCRKCFKTKGRLKKHSLSHKPGHRAFVCALSACGKRFKTQQKLKQHAVTHVDDSSWTFFCNVTSCGKSFKAEPYLISHKLVHSDALPFECNECNFRFKRKSNLKSHIIKNHSESSKMLFCDMSGCGRHFASKRSLMQHAVLHADDVSRKFVCDESSCGKRFKLKHILVEHKQIHSGVKPFGCSECSYRFLRKGQLKTHMLVHSKRKSVMCPRVVKVLKGNSI